MADRDNQDPGIPCAVQGGRCIRPYICPRMSSPRCWADAWGRHPVAMPVLWALLWPAIVPHGVGRALWSGFGIRRQVAHNIAHWRGVRLTDQEMRLLSTAPRPRHRPF